jgi:uncharacterized ferredoxin-like protein
LAEEKIGESIVEENAVDVLAAGIEELSEEEAEALLRRELKKMQDD